MTSSIIFFMKSNCQFFRSNNRLFRLFGTFALVLWVFSALSSQAGEKAFPPSHTVKRGDTLWEIARTYGIDVSDLKEINGIKGSKILVGQKLRLRTAPAHNHIVERGDSLWEIAHAYGMTLKELKKINGLTSNTIYPGQKLQLGTRSYVPPETYTVKKGDYLARIARLHQMSVSEIKKLNGMRNSVIYPGRKLKVNPILRKSHELSAITEIPWDDLMASSGGLKRIPAGNGPYYGQRPKVNQQPSTVYYEGPPNSVTRSYRQARKLWLAFDREITRVGRLSDNLEGWHFVLDPGHGGLDPGAVVENLDGNGKKVYVVEDEYVYDLALRVYVMLRLHGAEVTMTLISPNHLIRDSNPPVRTFVNEKNEVYNSAGFNKKDRWSNWPNGGPKGNLSRRVAIARNAFEKAPKKRRIFLSFHADIDHKAPEAPLVLYYESRNRRRVDTVSRNFARGILTALGAGAHARGQNLGVLRDNPAFIKVIVELRNLAYTDHAWALRFEQLRQRDAEKVVRGVLNYVEQAS
ncbi:MAG: LysM peptidoglycan-binding domain-containing protein [Deltaproteobacteria bacterium]|nr:LysM peptidoglycan-binding domain-containing protein [Deltaproteobacteria bacterium]